MNTKSSSLPKEKSINKKLAKSVQPMKVYKAEMVKKNKKFPAKRIRYEECCDFPVLQFGTV